MWVGKRTSIIYLLRNDLRIHDNECLKWANANADFVIPLYCFDPDHYRGTYHHGFPKTGHHRAKFIIQSVQDLRASLLKRGSHLIVRHDRPINAIQTLLKQCQTSFPVSAVVFHKEVCSEELEVESSIEKLCQSEGITSKSFWGSTLFHIDDLPFAGKKAIPDTYTQFRTAVENKTKVRNLIDLPEALKPLPEVKDGKLGEIPGLKDLGLSGEDVADPRSAFPFPGGESSGIERLNNYFWKTDHVSKYKETRNGLIGEDYSTKFSTWLATGSLSPRFIYHKLKQYEKERISNQSTYWVIFELIWRDYFKFVCWKYGATVFYPGGIMKKKLKWKQDPDAFRKWCEGQTGVPFVDANMRELLHTGWMSNRGRQNVASFLVKDLCLDWRLGAEWFESLLLDHDVCSNYGNWNYSAGIGNDPREDRKFNMIKQALDYDPDGDYIRMWVPELAKISGGKVHSPWSLTVSDAKSANFSVGSDYPKPIVIAPEWARHFNKKPAGPAGSRPLAGGKRGHGGKGGQRGIDFYFKNTDSKK